MMVMVEALHLHAKRSVELNEEGPWFGAME